MTSSTADADRSDRDYWTPHHFVLHRRYATMTRTPFSHYLIATNFPDRDGLTPAYIESWWGDNDIVRSLLDGAEAIQANRLYRRQWINSSMVQICKPSIEATPCLAARRSD